jgi:hypothetical protein
VPEEALVVSGRKSGKLWLRNVAFVGSEAAPVRGLYVVGKADVAMQGEMPLMAEKKMKTITCGDC